ncbi:MAG: hypothetical protein KAJ37_11010, partial [Candidatus Krumholzibacteria bacterium]|nr:hypothetical protein [Candidatus Krumholzibacteria bacterium]
EEGYDRGAKLPGVLTTEPLGTPYQTSTLSLLWTRTFFTSCWMTCFLCGLVPLTSDPFHTIHDGDVLYAVTTNELDPPPLQDSEISYMASELAWDAVLASF